MLQWSAFPKWDRVTRCTLYVSETLCQKIALYYLVFCGPTDKNYNKIISTNTKANIYPKLNIIIVKQTY